MRAVVQRVSEAVVEVGSVASGQIGPGLLVLLGIESADTEEDVDWLTGKLVQLRIFADDQGLMNRSVLDAEGGILLVSQFTLLASTRKGKRPSWHRAARPDVALPLFQTFHQRLESLLGRPIPTGVFGAEMTLRSANQGPVTLVLDSRLRE